MYGIFRYANGLQFTGLIAYSEEEAWDYLDKKYGEWIHGVFYGCNRRAFEVQKLTTIPKMDIQDA